MIPQINNLYKDQNDIQRIVIMLPGVLYFQSGLRDFAFQIVKNLTELGEQWSFRFQMIVDELCNNAIEYGTKNGEEILLGFYLKQNEWLEIVVIDTGTGDHPMKAKDIENFLEKKKQETEITLEGLRGRGLAKIVSSWTDELIFSDQVDGGLMVRARKYLTMK